jgi:DNA-binding response OmpR family regulator
LADEALWAEVLNLGGYDVLTKPFDPKEVHHAVSMACGFRRRKSATFTSSPAQPKVGWGVA